MESTSGNGTEIGQEGELKLGVHESNKGKEVTPDKEEEEFEKRKIDSWKTTSLETVIFLVWRLRTL